MTKNDSLREQPLTLRVTREELSLICGSLNMTSELHLEGLTESLTDPKGAKVDYRYVREVIESAYQFGRLEARINYLATLDLD